MSLMGPTNSCLLLGGCATTTQKVQSSHPTVLRRLDGFSPCLSCHYNCHHQSPPVLQCLTICLLATDSIMKFQNGLQQGLLLAQQSCTPRHHQRREASISRFQDWLTTSASFRGHTLATCDHEDIISYLAGHWSQQRSSVGPGALYREISYLRVWFDTHGRHGPSYSAKGNPTCHPLVKQMCKGQLKQAAPRGHQPYCAVPLTWSKLEHVLQQMVVWSNIPPLASNPQKRLALTRDACLFLFCWDGAMRGINGLRVKWTDFFFDTTGPNVPLSQFLSGAMVPGSSLCLRAMGVKAYQGKRAPGLTFAYEPSTYNFVACLQQYLIQLRATGYDCEKGVLFPSMHGELSRWRPMADTRMRLLISKHFTRAGCFAGETCHSFRRGSLQFANSDLGADSMALSALAQIKTPVVLNRYLSITRPQYPARKSQGQPTK
jgi:hypothetical protein